jgi:hypothetical protein
MRVLRDLLPLILLASWPFVAFLAANRDQIIHPHDVLLPWGAILGIAVALALLAWRGGKGPSLSRLAILGGILIAAFFSFGGLARLLSALGIELGTVWLVVWALLFTAAGGLTWILSRHRAANLVATVAALAMIAGPAVALAPSLLAGTDGAPEDEAGAAEKTDSAPAAARPNVYWFLLDGYVRDDSLKRYFDHDNEPFLRFLDARGFRIGRTSYSNYDNTTFSLTSTLSMDYAYLPGQKRPDPRGYTRTLSGFNPVVRGFKARGYRYLHAPYAGSAKTQCGGLEDRCIRGRAGGRIALNEVQVGLLRLTPLLRVLRRVAPSAFRYDHIFVKDVMAALRKGELGTAKPGAGERRPFFLFAHILSPHAPPRHAPDCTPLGKVAPSIDVGEGVYDPVQFRTDVACLNRSVMAAVDEVLKTDPSDPIVIFQGDHGFKFRLPGEPRAPAATPGGAAEHMAAARRLAILNAIRLPAACSDEFRPDLSPVNTFRLVFACLEGRAPELLPDRHFLRRAEEDGGGLLEVEPKGRLAP